VAWVGACAWSCASMECWRRMRSWPASAGRQARRRRFRAREPSRSSSADLCAQVCTASRSARSACRLVTCASVWRLVRTRGSRRRCTQARRGSPASAAPSGGSSSEPARDLLWRAADDDGQVEAPVAAREATVGNGRFLRALAGRGFGALRGHRPRSMAVRNAPVISPAGDLRSTLRMVRRTAAVSSALGK
ncbi:MAG: hypothetical protein QOI73_1396, partial [Solirubrobacteraceae bacterium]|nr:hypothetical protein [Solirubrobacteraceae bacterium]